jgi:hypothetical protein
MKEINNSRVTKLGLESWRNAVRSVMLDFCCGTCSESKVRREIAKFERKEAISLLELAIWEKHIVSDGLFFSSVQEMHEYQILEEGFNPREFAAQLRISSGAQSIIPRVLEFLGPAYVVS